MRKEIRKEIRKIALFLALCAAAACLTWALWERDGRTEYTSYVLRQREQAFYELTDGFERLGIQVQKLLVSSEKHQTLSLLVDVTRQTDLVRNSLTLLPGDDESLMEAYRFVNQIGEYARTLSLSVLDAEQLAEGDRGQLQEVLGQCQRLTKTLETLQGGYLAGATLDQTLSLTLGEDEVSAEELDYPSLIYDGAFSDATQGAPLGLGELVVEDGEDALRIAGAFVGEERVVGGEVIGSVNGEIPAHWLRLELKEDGYIDVQVTVQGGEVIEILAESTPTSADYDAEACVQNARTFLSKNFAENFELHYFQMYQNMVVLNFVPVTDAGVLLYPDSIKVQVSQQTGNVVGYEAADYLRNHVQRTLEAPQVSQEQALALGARINPETARLCVIPFNQREIQCWEVYGTYGGVQYLLYIDAAMGREVNLLQVVDVEGGKMVV